MPAEGPAEERRAPVVVVVVASCKLVPAACDVPGVARPGGVGLGRSSERTDADADAPAGSYYYDEACMILSLRPSCRGACVFPLRFLLLLSKQQQATGRTRARSCPGVIIRFPLGTAETVERCQCAVPLEHWQ